MIEFIHGAPAIIGICGPRHSGKDTTAARLLPWFRMRTKQTNVTWFAEPLYQMVELLTGVPVEKLREQGYKDTPWTIATAPIPTLVGICPRTLLKDLGMWVRDEVHAEHWAAHLKQRTARGVNGWKSWWFVPDTRFVNETSVCDLVIEVRREGIEYDEDHPSEKRLPPERIHHTVWLTPDMDYPKLANVIVALVEQVRMRCRDCGKSVAKLNEFGWMVHDRVWREATRRAQRTAGVASTYDLCCIRCFEDRLGRPLRSEDFNWDVPLNVMMSYDRSPLLRRRMRS